MVGYSTLITALLSIGTAFATPITSPNPTYVKREGAGPADFVLGPNHALARRATVDYDQDYTTGGDVVVSYSGDYYHVAWDVTSSEDFVVGVGWTTGSTLPITYNGLFGAGSGTGLFSVYGWTTSPLVEYYIVEDSLNPPSFGTYKGSVTSDGSTYEIYENTRTNEPSIVGTATFNQYISVRTGKRAAGTVTVENHFSAWASLGMELGAFSYQVLATEGWGGEGVAYATVTD